MWCQHGCHSCSKEQRCTTLWELHTVQQRPLTLYLSSLLFRLVFSCLVFCLSSFFSLSCSVFFLCLSLSLSPCDVVCGVVVCPAENHRESIQNVSVYASTTHMMKHMCVWCQYTRGRFEWTHGRQGGHRHFCLPKFAHTRLSLAPEVHQKKPVDPTHFLKFENRSRTTCSGFLCSFALPNEAVKLQLSWGTLRREPAERWFDLSVTFLRDLSHDLHVNIASPPRFSWRCASQDSFTIAQLHATKHNTQTHIHTNTHIYTRIQTQNYMYLYIYIYAHIHMHISIYPNVEKPITYTCTCCKNISIHVCVCLSLCLCLGLSVVALVFLRPCSLVRACARLRLCARLRACVFMGACVHVLVWPSLKSRFWKCTKPFCNRTVN